MLGAGAAGLAAAPAQEKPPQRLLFDTDIGADVDDALALIYLLNSPELDVRGVGTVVRNTYRRAQYARKLVTAMGRGRIPCCAGCELPLTAAGRKLRGFAEWVRNQPIAGYGDDGELGRSDNPPVTPGHAVDLLLRATREAEGPRWILATGPQTNLAMALLQDPSLADRVEGITLMGYSFRTGLDRYNVGWDVAAARHVLASGIPLRVLPIEIGAACQMQPPEYESLLASRSPQMEVVRESLRRWVEYVRRRPGAPIPDYLPRPYDSLAAMTLTHPHLFEWKRGHHRTDAVRRPGAAQHPL